MPRTSKAIPVTIDRKAILQKRLRATVTGTRVLDRSLHKTNRWLKELMVVMNWDNREKALAGFRATLHALRDVMPLYEILDLGAQLPIIVRGLFFENWRYNPTPLRLKTISQFYALVREKLGMRNPNFSNEEIRKMTRTSLCILSRNVSAGEMRDVRGVLKKRLRALIDEPIREPVGRMRTLAPVEGPPRARPTLRRARTALTAAKRSRRRRTEERNQNSRLNNKFAA